MSKIKVLLTASAFLLTVGGVFASTLLPETGYYFNGSTCIANKQCQLDDLTKPLCTAIIEDEPVQLFRLDPGTPPTCVTTQLREVVIP